MSNPTRVAVATQGRDRIDLHFGGTETFAVYDVDAAGPHYVETRAIADFFRPGEGEDAKREVILRAIADCKALFVARVGDGPRQKLAGAGIETVDAYANEAVDASLNRWYGDRA